MTGRTANSCFENFPDQNYLSHKNLELWPLLNIHVLRVYITTLMWNSSLYSEWAVFSIFIKKIILRFMNSFIPNFMINPDKKSYIIQKKIWSPLSTWNSLILTWRLPENWYLDHSAVPLWNGFFTKLYFSILSFAKAEVYHETTWLNKEHNMNTKDVVHHITQGPLSNQTAKHWIIIDSFKSWDNIVCKICKWHWAL